MYIENTIIPVSLERNGICYCQHRYEYWLSNNGGIMLLTPVTFSWTFSGVLSLLIFFSSRVWIYNRVTCVMNNVQFTTQLFNSSKQVVSSLHHGLSPVHYSIKWSGKCNRLGASTRSDNTHGVPHLQITYNRKLLKTMLFSLTSLYLFPT